MQRAEYTITKDKDSSELRHSALNFDLYTHFTSPIRRYPDLVVHRQLKYILNKMGLLYVKKPEDTISPSTIVENINAEEKLSKQELNIISTETFNKTLQEIPREELALPSTRNDDKIKDNQAQAQAQPQEIGCSSLIEPSNAKNSFNINKNNTNDISERFSNSETFLDFVINQSLKKLNEESNNEAVEEKPNKTDSDLDVELLTENKIETKSINLQESSTNPACKCLENQTKNEFELEHYINYERHIDRFNEKYYNGKMISTKCQKVFQCIILKNTPNELYKALIVDMSNKVPMKNKRPNQQTNFDTQTLVISIFIPRLNLELVKKQIYFILYLYIYIYIHYLPSNMYNKSIVYYSFYLCCL